MFGKYVHALWLCDILFSACMTCVFTYLLWWRMREYCSSYLLHRESPDFEIEGDWIFSRASSFRDTFFGHLHPPEFILIQPNTSRWVVIHIVYCLSTQPSSNTIESTFLILFSVLPLKTKNCKSRKLFSTRLS